MGFKGLSCQPAPENEDSKLAYIFLSMGFKGLSCQPSYSKNIRTNICFLHCKINNKCLFVLSLPWRHTFFSLRKTLWNYSQTINAFYLTD
jgi:hypothetical protein